MKSSPSFLASLHQGLAVSSLSPFLSLKVLDDDVGHRDTCLKDVTKDKEQPHRGSIQLQLKFITALPASGYPPKPFRRKVILLGAGLSDLGSHCLKPPVCGRFPLLPFQSSCSVGREPLSP